MDALYIDAYVILDRPDVIADLRAAGYDGAIHGGNGVTGLEPEYKVFDHSQAEVVWKKKLGHSKQLDLGPGL